MVSISQGNKKMGGIPSFSLPPVVTCRECAECAKKCYARRMAAFHKTVGAAWARNLNEWRENPEGVRRAIMSASLISSYFRYFVGGDIPDPAFLEMMVDVARAVPSCRFLAFTKKWELVNAYIDERGDLPENLQIVFSGWSDLPPNPHNLPASRVIFRGEEEPRGAKVCGGNCAECICKGVACWTLKSGEVIHFYEH